MREKYESLALVDLKEIAKARGMKGTSTMKKAEVIEAMLLEDEKEKKAFAAAEYQESAPEKKSRGRKSVIKNVPDGRNVTESRKTGGNTGRDSGDGERNDQGAESSQGEGRKQAENRSQGEGKGQYENRNQSEGRSQQESRNQAEGRKGQNEGRVQQDGQFRRENRGENRVESRGETPKEEEKYPADLDSGITAHGILEVMPDGYGFIRCENYLPGENDVYVAPSQIRRFNLKTGDILEGNTRIKTQSEKFSALLYVKTINGYTPEVAMRRCNFEDMTPIFPNERLNLETPGASVAMRIMDLISPVGKGQRGMIVSQPKAGKTTLLKEVAKSVKKNSPEVHLIILLIDERPEEVTDIKEAIEGPNVEVIYSTFDELPEHHKRVSEMVIERAKRLVEHKKDVMILLDSITRLTRADGSAQRKDFVRRS